MKSFIVLLAFLCGAPLFLAAETPLTLTYENYGVIAPGDFLSWNTIATTSIPMPTTGENQQWDYSNVQNTGSVAAAFTTPQNAVFPTATIASGIAFVIVGNRVEGERFEEISTQGYFSLGHSLQETIIPIDQGIIKGKLVVPTQNVHTGRTQVQFPATYGSTWGTPDTRVVANAKLTVLLYNDAPTQLVQHYITHDTIVGWGRLTVPGNSSHDVLLHKQTIIQIDSFYINSEPAPELLLGALQAKQGDTTFIEYYSFYAAHVKGEVLQIGTFTRQGETSTVAQYNSNLPTSVEEHGRNAVSLQLYPTPIANTATTVEFDKTSNGTWSIVLHNALGQVVQNILIDNPIGHIRTAFELSPALPNGTYFYTLRNEQSVPVGYGTVPLTR